MSFLHRLHEFSAALQAALSRAWSIRRDPFTGAA
ncbi:hypothetical protein J2S30_004101 [Herbaspirillum rubrisubalbicans]|nr:hypothetical protein [Herbaspirillum rubrisubalbicans]